MLKAVFRPGELIAIQEKIVIDSPTSFAELAHFAPVEEAAEDAGGVEEYTGPTADDLRREAEHFKKYWEEEKERMINSARAEAENIVQNARQTASVETQRKTDEAQMIKQQAQAQADRIMADAKAAAALYENEARQTLETQRKESNEQGREAGREEGYADGKAEVDRLIERTQVVLERAQDKRGEILSETEKEIVDLVLLITRKVIKVISENQRDVIISNVIEALRKVKAKGNAIIRVNLADLKLAAEHKQDFIKMMENARSVHIVEDTTVDPGGCIIETDFGEIDARIASQLAELESKILEISPIRSNIKDNTPPPIIRTANLNTELIAATSLMDAVGGNPIYSPQTLPSFVPIQTPIQIPMPVQIPAAMPQMTAPQQAPQMTAPQQIPQAPAPVQQQTPQMTAPAQQIPPEPEMDQEPEDEELSRGVNAALTASAALAALATMAAKGKRDSDKKIAEKMEEASRRKED